MKSVCRFLLRISVQNLRTGIGSLAFKLLVIRASFWWVEGTRGSTNIEQTRSRKFAIVVSGLMPPLPSDPQT